MACGVIYVPTKSCETGGSGLDYQSDNTRITGVCSNNEYKVISENYRSSFRFFCECIAYRNGFQECGNIGSTKYSKCLVIFGSGYWIPTITIISM